MKFIYLLPIGMPDLTEQQNVQRLSSIYEKVYFQFKFYITLVIFIIGTQWQSYRIQLPHYNNKNYAYTFSA